MKLDNYASLLSLLHHGKSSAKNSERLWIESGRPGSLNSFRRKLRIFSHEARLNGHWIVADDNGYYIALSKEEWNAYKNRRLKGISDEITAIANCDRTSIGDLVKRIFSVKVDNPNYELF